MRRLVLVAVAAATLAFGLHGCSFTTASGFTECRADSECGSAAACSFGYCLSLPEGCRRDVAPDGGAFDQGTRIPIAVAIPLTRAGVPDNSELQGLNAMRLAVSEANDRLGIKSRLFGLFICDTLDNDERTDRQVSWLVDNLRVPAVLTSGSGQTLRAARNPSRLDAGTLVLSATATSPGLISTFQTEKNVWRVAPPDTLQAKVVSDLVRADYPDAGGSLIGILHMKGEYGDGFANPTAERLRALGYVVIARPFDEEDLQEHNTAVNELSNDRPAATVIIGYPANVVALIGFARTRPALAGADGGHRWYLTDAAKDPAILDGGLPELDRALGTAPAQGAGAAFNTFRDGFRTRFGQDPNSFSYTSHSYDAMWLVMLATAWATQGSGELTGPRLGEGFTKLVAPGQVPIPLRSDKWVEASNLLSQGSAINVEGSSGPLDFDLDAGAPASAYEIWQVRDGGISFVRLVNP